MGVLSYFFVLLWLMHLGHCLIQSSMGLRHLHSLLCIKQLGVFLVNGVVNQTITIDVD